MTCVNTLKVLTEVKSKQKEEQANIQRMKWGLSQGNPPFHGAVHQNKLHWSKDGSFAWNFYFTLTL